MKGLSQKLKLIFYPFLIVAIGFILIYCALYWVLFIKFDFINIKEDIIEYWLPFSLPWIPVLIWLRPRVHLLRFKNDNAYFAYQFIATLAISVPTIIAENYLSTATGKLTKLENITQFKKLPRTKYYSLNTYFIEKSSSNFHSAATVSGRYNDKLNYAIYVVLPIRENLLDSIAGPSNYWIGKKYSRQISNRQSESEKQIEYTQFAEETQKDFDNTNFQQFIYLERIGNTYDLDEFRDAVKKSPLAQNNVPVIFKAINEPYEKRNGESLAWVFGAFGIGSLVYLILLLFPSLKDNALGRSRKGARKADTDLKEMFSLLIPKEGFFATAIIMDLNILIYLLMVFSGLGVISFKTEDLVKWGGNVRALTTNGEWWRLLTNIFIHGGLMHIAANMVGLLFVGLFLEPVIGRIKYSVIYLATGIIASCASIYWHPEMLSVGASGAIFGLYGLFLALLLLKVFPKDFSNGFLISTLLFVGYNLLIGLNGGVDNAAHIGGLVSGFIIGSFMSPSIKRRKL